MIRKTTCTMGLCLKTIGVWLILSVSTGTTEVLHTLVSPNEEYSGYFGITVAGAGDVNGDGKDDIVVGASSEDPGSSPLTAGRVYVFDGDTGILIHTLVSPNEQYQGYFGGIVSGAGDVNDDGYDDVAIGAIYESSGTSPDRAGRVYVFDGDTGNLIHALSSPNEEETGMFGRVSGAGDVNGDGKDDIIVGAYFEDPGTSPTDAGRAYVFDGDTGNLIHTLVSPNEQYHGYFGWSVSGVGDVNGDTFDDILVGAYHENSGTSPSGAGRAYLFDGVTGNPIRFFISPNEEQDGWFGYSLSRAGDVNGDGYPDVAIGVPCEDPGSSPSTAGRAYIFDGETGDLLHTLVSPNEEYDGNFGCSISGIGDLNGDGFDDVVVGAYKENPGSSPANAGCAYVFDGETGDLLRTLISPNEEVEGYFGHSIAGMGDVNGDGFDEVVVGAYKESPGSSPSCAGRAYIFSWMHLFPSVSGSTLEIQWSTWSPATEYWIYGADNNRYYVPGFVPDYEYRVDVVLSPTNTWSTTNGIGDPDHDWTYMVIAVDGSENELARTRYGGENDFAIEIR